MTTRGVPLYELPIGEQERILAEARARHPRDPAHGERVASLGLYADPADPTPTSRPGKRKSANRDEAAIGRKRGRTGSAFEGELDATHTRWRFLRWGNIRRNNAPSKVIRSRSDGAAKRIITGAADVDRTGWVNVTVQGDHYVGRDWRTGGDPLPVAFDAKVQPESSDTYYHAVELQHQLHSLKDAALAGEYSFLLVQVPKFYDTDWIPGGAPPGGRVFLLPILDHFDALLAGRGVQTYRREGGRGTGTLRSFVPLVPCIGWSAESLGWDWIPLLHHADPSRVYPGVTADRR